LRSAAVESLQLENEPHGFREIHKSRTLKAGERLFGELGRIAVADHAGDQLVLEFETPPVNLKVAIDLRSWSASPPVNPAQTIATRIADS
jgi:hypothetical protein